MSRKYVIKNPSINYYQSKHINPIEYFNRRALNSNFLKDLKDHGLLTIVNDDKITNTFQNLFGSSYISKVTTISILHSQMSRIRDLSKILDAKE